MAVFAHTPKMQFFDSNGDPLNGGKVYTYEVGTTTDKATYPTLADAVAATNANANPVILDSRGEAVICLTGPTKFKVDDSADNNIYTVDNYYPESNGTIYDSNNNIIMKLTATSSAVNRIEVKNQSTGVRPEVNSDGESNLGIEFNDSNDNELLQLQSLASATNFLSVENAATGNNPTVSSEGESNIGITLRDSNGNELLTLTAVGSAVNYLDIDNGATGEGITVTCNGSDTDVSYFIQPQGAGVVGILGTSTTSAEVRLYEDTDNGSNYLGFKAPSAITSSVTFTLPDGDGTNGQVIVTNGSGTLSWANNT